MRTYLELKTDVAKLAQRSTGTGGATFKLLIGVWLQLSHSLLAEIFDFWLELQGIHNFTSVDEQEDYPLPQRFDKPFRLYDLTNDKRILPITEEVYFDANIANIADAVTGIPDKFRLYGATGTRIAISSSGDTVKAKSSVAESPTVTITVRGFIDSAKLIEDTEDIVVTGTSFKTASAPKTFYEIISWSKSRNSTGYITLADSAGTTLDTLAPTERVARHIVLKLGKIPDDAYFYRLLYKKTIVQMVNDNDYPFIDADRYLTFDAYGYALKQTGSEQKANFAWQKAEQALTALLNNQGEKLGTDYQQRIITKWAQSHRR